MPAISVIMNCLNGERFVRQAIESIYGQTFNDWEIIFWDNGSTDGTANIAKSFDQRLRYFRSEETVPLGAARRLAMEKATGRWIAFQDHDDVSLPQRFELQMAAIGERDFAFCYGGMKEIDQNDATIRDRLPRYDSGDQFAKQLAQFDANLQTTIVSASYLKIYGIHLDESFFMFEDYNLFMKLAAKGPVCVVREILSYCRVISTSETTTSLERHSSEWFRTLEQLRLENPGIEARFPEAFREAEARGQYFSARYDMARGNYAKARLTMRLIAGLAPVYAALYCLSWWPWAWHITHDRKLKSKLTGLLLHRSSVGN